MQFGPELKKNIQDNDNVHYVYYNSTIMVFCSQYSFQAQLHHMEEYFQNHRVMVSNFVSSFEKRAKFGQYVNNS